MNFGQKLYETRKEKGLTQLQLAEKAKMSQALISYYEKGSRNPTINLAVKLAKALDVEIEKLLED